MDGHVRQSVQYRRDISAAGANYPSSVIGIAPAEDAISATVPDWSREHKRLLEWLPGRSLLASIRAYQRYSKSRSPIAFILKRVAVLRHRFWSVIAGADIPLTCRIGGGLLLPHPNGVVIHPEAEIGPNCLIFQQVTVGCGRGGVPSIGGHVDFGAGAKVIGRITVGNHVVIGANAVVVKDVPAGMTAVGVPARYIAR
jgi:serine O-acetyltransferase